MSCLRLRKIKNPIDSSRRTRFDKQYINIPDCQCDKCRKTKKNDWLVRSYFEFSSKPHDAFFVTLDFDESHLPHYNGKPCFDGRIIHSFNEVLRQACPVSFRYLIVSDYGDAFQRPHYHAAYIFDKDAISLDEFFGLVAIYWKYGQHTNIQQINSSYKNTFKAFEYVCKYSLKDFQYTLAAREAGFPHRFRSQVHASIGYGCQCMDPNEFNSLALLKRGLSFNDVPVITKDYLKNNTCVYISPKNDGVLVPYSIPRYYEMKLMYNYHWDSVEKKANLWRNDDGKELQRIRHNCHYIYYRDKFMASRNNGLCNYPIVHELFNKYFPDSPYNGLLWHDIYDDVIKNKYLHSYFRLKDYFEFGKYKVGSSFFDKQVFSLIPSASVDKYGNKYYKVSSVDEDVESEFFYISDEYINRCIEACFIFDLYCLLSNLSKADYLDWVAREDRKTHMRDKLKRFPNYRYYLLRKKFNFSSLNPSTYVSQYPLKTY